MNSTTTPPIVGDGSVGLQIELLTPIVLLGLVTLGIAIARPLIIRRIERRTSLLKEEWHLKSHLLFSNFLLAASFIAHSCYAIMPFNFAFAIKTDPSDAVSYLLSHDTLAVFNCLHGIFVFGGAVRYLWTKKPLWWFLLLLAHIFMLCTSGVAFFLCLLQCFTFGTIVFANAAITATQLIINIYCVYSVLSATPARLFAPSLVGHESKKDHPHASLKPQPDAPIVTDPETEAWKMKLLRVLYLEVLHFILYNIALVAVRVPVASTTIVSLDRFVYQFVQAYVLSIHRGIVIAFGFQGATNHSISALRMYQFAQYLMGGIAAASLVPMAYTMYTAYDSLYWLSVVVIVTQVVLQITGALYAGIIIDMTGGSLHEDTQAADQAALVSTASVESLRVRAWLLAVLVTWQAEAVLFIILQLWTEPNIKVIAGGVNYAFHGLFILLISLMRGNVATGAPSRRRRYQLLLYAVLTGISLFEVASVAVAWFVHKQQSTAMAIFFFTAGARLWVSIGAGVAFLLVDLQAGRELRRAEQQAKEQSPAVEPVLKDEALVMQRETMMSGEKLDESSPAYIALQRRAELAIKAAGFGGLFFVFAILAVLREDYAALVGPYTSADVGAHSPAYVMAFHLCLLLVGWGILGVRWHRIGYTVTSCFGFSGLALVGGAAFLVALRQWNLSSFNSNAILFGSASLFLPSTVATIVMVQYILMLQRANVNPLHFVW